MARARDDTPTVPDTPVIRQAVSNSATSTLTEFDINNLTKVQQMHKLNGTISDHLRNIFEAQTDTFKGNATKIGETESTLEKHIESRDIIQFRKEMLRVFEKTYKEMDRLQAIQDRVNALKYNTQDQIIGLIKQVTILATDMTSIPARTEELHAMMNRKIWSQLIHCNEEAIRMVASTIDPDMTSLQETHDRLMKLHGNMIANKTYRAAPQQAHAYKAEFEQREKKDGTPCPACMHNFNPETPIYHSVNACKFHPMNISVNTQRWFKDKWEAANKDNMGKKPYVYETAAAEPGPAAKRSRKL